MEKGVDSVHILVDAINTLRDEPLIPPPRRDLIWAQKKSKMKTIQILEIANGENITRLPQVTVRADGTLWVNKNTSPLVTPSATLDKPSLLALLEAKAYDKIPAENYLRINQTVNGRECLDQVDADARRAARLTPAQKAEIETAKQNARRARNYDRLQNEGEEGYNPYRAAADDDDRTPYHKGDNQAD